MATQLQPGLFDPPPASSSQQAFEEFHRRNPKVYSLLCDYARRMKARGFDRYSIKTIWAVLRWHTDTGTQGQEHWKLNDRYYSRYAREIMQREPDLKDFFNTRELRTK